MTPTRSRIIGLPMPADLCTATGKVTGGPLVTIANTEPHDHPDGDQCYAVILLADNEDQQVATTVS